MCGLVELQLHALDVVSLEVTGPNYSPLTTLETQGFITTAIFLEQSLSISLYHFQNLLRAVPFSPTHSFEMLIIQNSQYVPSCYEP